VKGQRWWGEAWSQRAILVFDFLENGAEIIQRHSKGQPKFEKLDFANVAAPKLLNEVVACIPFVRSTFMADSSPVNLPRIGLSSKIFMSPLHWLWFQAR